MQLIILFSSKARLSLTRSCRKPREPGFRTHGKCMPVKFVDMTSSVEAAESSGYLFLLSTERLLITLDLNKGHKLHTVLAKGCVTTRACRKVSFLSSFLKTIRYSHPIRFPGEIPTAWEMVLLSTGFFRIFVTGVCCLAGW